MRAYQTFLATVGAIGIILTACVGPATNAGHPLGGPASAVDAPAAVHQAEGARPTIQVVAPSTPIAALATPALNPPVATRVANPTAVAPPAVTSANPTSSPTARPATPATPAAAPTVATPSAIRYAVVADGTQAAYRVREQLAGRSLPNDAVGTTTGVTGQIELTADGKVHAERSKFVVDLSTLRSDSGLRDSYLRRSTLESSRFPTAVFVPTEIRGLPSPLPASGQPTFQLIGNLTVHGTTRPVTWEVTSQISGNDLTAKATTAFTFQDFGLTPPRAASVLSVEDTVKLELTIHLVKGS